MDKEYYKEYLNNRTYDYYGNKIDEYTYELLREWKRKLEKSETPPPPRRGVKSQAKKLAAEYPAVQAALDELKEAEERLGVLVAMIGDTDENI